MFNVISVIVMQRQKTEWIRNFSTKRSQFWHLLCIPTRKREVVGGCHFLHEAKKKKLTAAADVVVIFAVTFWYIYFFFAILIFLAVSISSRSTRVCRVLCKDLLHTCLTSVDFKFPFFSTCTFLFDFELHATWNFYLCQRFVLKNI